MVRMTLVEASHATGMSVDNLRARIKRGQLQAEKDERGRITVLLPEEELSRSPDIVPVLQAQIRDLAEERKELRAQVAKLTELLELALKARQTD